MTPEDFESLRDQVKNYADANGADYLKTAVQLFDSFLEGDRGEGEGDRTHSANEGWYYQ